MKPEEQIKALAELDGWTEIVLEEVGICGFPNGKRTGPLGCGLALVDDYLHSYDAIIPLIEKQERKIRCKAMAALYMDSATPAQLCEALLRATRKWTE